MSNKLFGVLLSLCMALNTFAADKFKVGDLYYTTALHRRKTKLLKWRQKQLVQPITQT